MNLDWQNAVVLLLVTGAFAYLVRAAWRSVARRKSPACGGCGTCPAGAAPQAHQLVGISPPERAEERL
jgi:hypothetical protein